MGRNSRREKRHLPNGFCVLRVDEVVWSYSRVSRPEIPGEGQIEIERTDEVGARVSEGAKAEGSHVEGVDDWTHDTRPALTNLRQKRGKPTYNKRKKPCTTKSEQ